MDNEGLNMKLIFLTLASFFFISSVSFAQTVGKQAEFNSALGVDYQSNLIKNPSAYKNAASVAVSSSSCIRGTTNKIDGKASWTVNTTALAGYCEFTLLVPSSEQTAGNCEYKGKFMGDGTLYSAQITDGSGNVLNSVKFTNEIAWRDYSVTYPCAASGTRKVRITQTTAGTSPDLSIGKMYYGSATNIGSAMGSITSNANASLRTESASISNTGVVAEKFGVDWINGNCSLTDTSLFTCSFNPGTFSGDPDCTPSIVNSTVIGVAPQVKLNADATSSSGVFRTYYTDNVTDIAKYAYNFKVTCTGPR